MICDNTDTRLCFYYDLLIEKIIYRSSLIDETVAHRCGKGLVWIGRVILIADSKALPAVLISIMSCDISVERSIPDLTLCTV